MKPIKIFLILFFSSFYCYMSYAQEAYASWAELRDSIPEGMRNSYENMKQNTPDKNVVELPPYPGAKIIETSMSTQSVDDSRNPNLPTITLISNDPAEKIINVYKDIIEDFPQWHWDANLKMFYKGNEQDALNSQSPYIQVTAIKTYEPDLIYISPDVLEVADSKIVVCYNPGKIKGG